ncbi:MAG: hypothetical protein ACI39R_06090 [Lachnospiraceae bacterium]
MAELQYVPGDYMTLGLSHCGKNTNFAVAIGDTDRVFLKLYKNPGDINPEIVLELDESFRYGNIFAVTIKNFTGKGYTYLYEAKGVSFVDPYARLISGREVYGKTLSKKEKKLIRAYVSENTFDWKDEKAPGLDLQELILYKLHVRGFTKALGGAYGGTYRGVVSKIPYLKELGINAVLLMPSMEYNEVCDAEPEVGVPEFVSSKFYQGSYKPEAEDRDNKQGNIAETVSPDRINPLGASSETLPYIKEYENKLNFWGYTSFYYFFAPKASYAYQPEKADYEFKYMVSKLHEAGIEVLMEVSIPRATNRSMMLDALRFWVREYRIDGFKLNLDCIDPNLIACDPYLSKAKLIGNSWNTDEIYPKEYTPDSKRLAIYNDAFSVEMRRFLKSDEGMAGNALNNLSCNAGKITRVNYITDHNGFTLADLYMYDVKHNEANGEQGRDGTDINYSWNCGVEGPDKHKKIRDLRMKMRRNAMAALLLSQGVPLIFSGDEIGNSQNGNNNAYCQDNEIGWVNWKKNKTDTEFLGFVKQLISIRKAHPVLRNKIELKKMDYLSSGKPDVSFHSVQAWYPDYNYYNRCVAVMYSGAYALVDRIHGDEDFYIACNMYWDEKEFEIPRETDGKVWNFVLATEKLPQKDYEPGMVVTEQTIRIPGRCILILKSRDIPVKAKGKRK